MTPLNKNFASEHRKVTRMIMIQMEICQNSLVVWKKKNHVNVILKNIFANIVLNATSL